MTTKLFWEDPYQTECDATVTEINNNQIKLNQTCFYAFSGGQESDEGTINDIKVVKATKEGDKESIIDITYELEETPNFKVGDQVTIKINKERRDNLRNLHSAAHLLYYIAIKHLGKIKIIGSNISEEKARMDFIYESSITEILPEIEKDLNQFLKEDHKITTKFDDTKQDLRWWSCGDWKMPCGGTHPRSTTEIGTIKLKRKNIGSGKQRIEIRLNN